MSGVYVVTARCGLLAGCVSLCIAARLLRGVDGAGFRKKCARKGIVR
jgi:hypothetical protein